jgi:hypothetical protein
MNLRSTARTERKWGSKRDSSSVVVAPGGWCWVSSNLLTDSSEDQEL